VAEDLNIVAPEPSRGRTTQGDVPDQVRRRFLTEERLGQGLGFYIDARTTTAAFRDHGRRLTTDRNDPHVIRDLVAIAQHRGWTTISVRGHSEFRREAWRLATAAGLEVQGYRPSERDRQQVERSASLQRPPARGLDVPTRMSVVETVVRKHVVEPAEQARILELARSRLARWLEPDHRASTRHASDRSR
jgi:hypothetical protein